MKLTCFYHGIILYLNMDTQNLLYNASQMPLTELQAFIHQLNGVVARKKVSDKNVRDAILLGKINSTVLEQPKRERYQTLIHKSEIEVISDSEQTELLKFSRRRRKNPCKKTQIPH